MSARTSALVLASAAAFALSACGNDAGTTATTPAAPAAGRSAAAVPGEPAVTATSAAKGCPVTADTLTKVIGDKIDPASIECSQDWAVANYLNPQGDGEIFFQFTGGRWVKRGEGSAVGCGKESDMNIPAATGLCGDAHYDK